MNDDCHPPCEDVSWKVPVVYHLFSHSRHPPCEDVSWKKFWHSEQFKKRRHPPCEDVSWKSCRTKQLCQPVKSSSLWGCELKDNRTDWRYLGNCHPPCEDVSWKNPKANTVDNALRHPPCEDVSWKALCSCALIRRISSSSLWGCELKDCFHCLSSNTTGHPPCEDVSWKNCCLEPFGHDFRHPPCEDVSWKTTIWEAIKTAVSSSSLWGCELKDCTVDQESVKYQSSSLWGCELKDFAVCVYANLNKVILLVRMWVERHYFLAEQRNNQRHPPCEDVSWKSNFNFGIFNILGHPPCEDVSWKIIFSLPFFLMAVILLVRMWVERFLLQAVQLLMLSSSLWGCELKGKIRGLFFT